MVTPSPTNPDAGKMNVVNFTINAAYKPANAAGAPGLNPTTASATPASAPGSPAPVQVAKN
jgi:hypothetical protein